jgi:hypothetical protein
MQAIQRIISAGFATAAIASASVPALAWSVWPDVDFEWYANVGKPVAGESVEIGPAPRAGYIWAPGHWENRDTHRTWVAGHWVADDYDQQRAMYASPARFATGSTVLLDRQGNVIPTSPDAYPVDSRR